MMAMVVGMVMVERKEAGGISFVQEQERLGGPLMTKKRLDHNSDASNGGYTAEEEQAVVRKFNRKLVVFLAALYLLVFLDRSSMLPVRPTGHAVLIRVADIGNARIAGMDLDLQSMPPRDSWYEWSLAAFHIAYIAFEWMAVLWRVIPAHIYVAVLVFSWGVIASLQSVAVNYPMLILLRTLLGIGEAGFTGVPFYLSFFFKRDELAFRTAIFISGVFEHACLGPFGSRANTL